MCHIYLMHNTTHLMDNTHGIWLIIMKHVDHDLNISLF